MAGPATSEQRANVERVEELIGAIAPALDFVLGFGERLSNAVQAEDPDYYPIRSGPEASLLERGEPDQASTAD